MVDDMAIAGPNISTAKACSTNILIAGLRTWERRSAGENIRPDKRRADTQVSKMIRDH